MRKIINVFYGLFAFIFGLNFTAQAKKTDFQEKLEKFITVKTANILLASECGQKPGGGGGDPIYNKNV